MDELKPCPFCGGEAKVVDHGGFFTVGCTNLDCAATIDLLEPSEENAVADWNRRAAPGNKPLTAEQLRQMDGEPVFSPQCGWGIIGFRKIGTGEQEHSKKYTVGFSYGWEWLDDVMRIGPLYAHKPEQEEK